MTDLNCSVPLLLLKTSGWDSVDRLEMLDAIASAATYTPPSSPVLLLSLSGRMVSEAKKEEIHGESAGRLLMPEATATTFSSPSSSVLLFHRAVNEAKSEDTRGETMLVDLRRQYHCYSYNLLIAIITCVQNEAKFYKGFLFQDNVAKVRC